MQVEILKFLQEISTPILDTIFILITNLGSETFYVLAITFIYWCVDKKLGITLLSITIISTYINIILKELFHTQRPIFTDGIKPLYEQSAPGFSFPSGHTQITATFWMYLMKELGKKLFYVTGCIVILLVGFSRLYLRLHWPIDVIGGILIAISIVFLQNIITGKVDKFRITFRMKIMLSIFISVVISLLMHDETIPKIAGVTAGALIGYLTEIRHVGFIEKSCFKYQLIKCIMGVLVLLGLQITLKQLLPSGIIFSYFRYFVLGGWVTLFAPILFIKLGVSSKYVNKEKIIS